MPIALNVLFSGVGDAEAADVKYKEDRKSEYPSWEDQLDKIYHSGINAWKADIKKIKDKYPKMNDFKAKTL